MPLDNKAIAWSRVNQFPWRHWRHQAWVNWGRYWCLTNRQFIDALQTIYWCLTNNLLMPSKQATYQWRFLQSQHGADTVSVHIFLKRGLVAGIFLAIELWRHHINYVYCIQWYFCWSWSQHCSTCLRNSRFSVHMILRNAFFDYVITHPHAQTSIAVCHNNVEAMELHHKIVWDVINNQVTPFWGDFMFSVCFRRVRVRRRKNFSLSLQNRFS